MPQPRRHFLKSFCFAPSANRVQDYLVEEQTLANSASDKTPTNFERPSEQFANGAMTISTFFTLDRSRSWSVLTLRT